MTRSTQGDICRKSFASEVVRNLLAADSLDHLAAMCSNRDALLKFQATYLNLIAAPFEISNAMIFLFDEGEGDYHETEVAAILDGDILFARHLLAEFELSTLNAAAPCVGKPGYMLISEDWADPTQVDQVRYRDFLRSLNFHNGGFIVSGMPDPFSPSQYFIAFVFSKRQETLDILEPESLRSIRQICQVFFLFWFSVFGHRSLASLANVVRKIKNLSSNQFEVLLNEFRSIKRTSKELAKELGISVSTVYSTRRLLADLGSDNSHGKLASQVIRNKYDFLMGLEH